MLRNEKTCYVIANFGGPRHLDEVRPFLEALLTDRDVIPSRLPSFLHNWVFQRVARKRTEKVRHDYQAIGGKSPIFDDTENVVAAVQRDLDGPVLAFHRYLPATHESFIEKLKKIECEEIRVFPMFPQFTYATTGSIARWFQKHLPRSTVNKIRWTKSYPTQSSFVKAHQTTIQEFLDQHQLQQEETILLFSAHGVPQSFIDNGDIYESECRASFKEVMTAFPKMIGQLCYQSKFGKGEWIKPYTIDRCQEIHSWSNGRKHVVFVPISFTSDHIETLFEIEQEYMTVIREKGLGAYRVPGLTLHPDWIRTIVEILQHADGGLCGNQMLILPN